MVGRLARARPAAAALVAAAAATLAACADLASTRDVRVTIVDERSVPVPGAVFYVEAADDSGAFAYLWRTAGRAGEVPDSAREPLKLPWRRGARLAMAAFAPGRRPAVVRETDERVISDGAVLVLEPGPAWDAEVAALAPPFEDSSALAARLAEAPEAPLLDAFRTAWEAAPHERLTPGEKRKRAILANRLRGLDAAADSSDSSGLVETDTRHPLGGSSRK